MVVQVDPVIDYSVRRLCYRPYAGHTTGCPNFGKRPTCPPAAPLFADVVDLSQPVYAIINEFNLSEFAKAMKAKHPNWTDKQCRCCLYWQGTARKQLKTKIAQFIREYRKYKVYTTPEAMGVNVTATLEQVGIILEWPVINIDRHVALAGITKAKYFEGLEE